MPISIELCTGVPDCSLSGSSSMPLLTLRLSFFAFACRAPHSVLLQIRTIHQYKGALTDRSRFRWYDRQQTAQPPRLRRRSGHLQGFVGFIERAYELHGDMVALVAEDTAAGLQQERRQQQ